MERLDAANTKLQAAHDDLEREYKATLDKLGRKEQCLLTRYGDLDKKKAEAAGTYGNADSSADDVLEINAGGKAITAKRSTLTQLKGTRMGALFSGRWDKQLQRDGRGRIFLDVNPKCFRAIVDYLHEQSISSEENPPTPPSVDDEHKGILNHQLEMFGLVTRNMPESNIIKTVKDVDCLHDWMKEDGTDGELTLLYRSSGGALSSYEFHAKCDNKGPTLTIIETTCGFVLGGYLNTPWGDSTHGSSESTKAFLFVLRGPDIASSCKMKLKKPNDRFAVCHSARRTVVFGRGHDLWVDGSHVRIYSGCSYCTSPSEILNSRGAGTENSSTVLNIKQMEVHQVSGTWSKFVFTTGKENGIPCEPPKFEPIDRFADVINEAINEKQLCLSEAEAEILHLEHGFEDEQSFIDTFASGDTHDVVTMNVSGTMMVTKRSTLQIAEESVLAQQFDESKWTQQGFNAQRAKEWTPEDVAAWVGGFEDVPADVASTLKKNEIKGRELLALNIEGLKMLGVTRPGTLCLLLKEIKTLNEACQDAMTLVQHSPYCFGKILDFLRLKRLHSQGLAEEPSLPVVCDTQKSRFEKVVNYYFPGDSAKFVLGETPTRPGKKRKADNR